MMVEDVLFFVAGALMAMGLMLTLRAFGERGTASWDDVNEGAEGAKGGNP